MQTIIVSSSATSPQTRTLKVYMHRNTIKFITAAETQYQGKGTCVTLIRCFDEIEAAIDNPRVVCSRLSWINSLLHTNERAINAINLATLFNRLAKTNELWYETEQPFHNQAMEILRFGLHLTVTHLTKKQTKHCSLTRQNYRSPHFTLRELCTVLKALPKLPIKWQTESTNMLIKVMLNKMMSALQESDQDTFIISNLPEISIILSKLKFNPQEHKGLVQFLLAKIEHFEPQFMQQPQKVQAKIWQCLAALQVRGISISEKICIIFQQLEQQIAQPIDVTTEVSKTQQIVTTQIRRLISGEANEDLKVEYFVGSYSMDIALPKYKLNIEIDGKHHYVNRELRLADQIRDFVLSKLKGFTIIRIPYFEWGDLPTTREKMIYLRNKLEQSDCKIILAPTEATATTHPQTSAPAPAPSPTDTSCETTSPSMSL